MRQTPASLMAEHTYWCASMIKRHSGSSGMERVRSRRRRWGLDAEMSARLQAGRLQRAGNASGAVILTALAGAIGLANAALGLFRR
jgi:hypothetical protein